MGTKREQPQGEVLPAHECRTTTPAPRNGKVEPDGRRHRRNPERNAGGSMSLRSRLRTWWKAVTHSEQLNGEIEDELAFHIEAYANDLMRSGLPRDEALRRARVELGGLSAQKENCR